MPIRVDDRSRYSYAGVNRISHRGKIVTTSVGVSRFDNLSKTADSAFQYEEGIIPPGYAHRPDLISNLFYDSPGFWWLLMLVNGVTDPFQDFKTGDRILIPKLR